MIGFQLFNLTVFLLDFILPFEVRPVLFLQIKILVEQMVTMAGGWVSDEEQYFSKIMSFAEFIGIVTFGSFASLYAMLKE